MTPTATSTRTGRLLSSGAKHRRPLGAAHPTFSECRMELREKHAEFARSRDRELRNQLVEAHCGLARQLAAKFTGRGENLDDLRQVAQIGLVKAVERYDPSYGTSFATFATPTIVGELKRHFRDRVWPIRVPRKLQELYMACRDSAELLVADLGRSPTCEEIADHLGKAPEEVREAMAAGSSFRTRSLDASPEEASAATGPSVVDDESIQTVDERIVLGELLARLPHLDREVVGMRIVGGLTQSEIAEQIGVSQVQVSRLLARVTKKLSQSAAADEDAETAEHSLSST